MSAKRPAQIVTSTLVVLCPYCGGEQQAPDNGSDNWLPEQITTHQGQKKCVECDAAFLLTPVNSARILK